MKIFRKIASYRLNHRSLSLQTKLIILYIVIIMVPVIAFTLYYTEQISNSAIRDATKKQEYLLELEKINIMNHIETMRRTAQIVISDRDFLDFIKKNHDSNTTDLLYFKSNVYSNIIKLQFNNPNINDIRIYTANPNIKEMWPVIFDESRINNKPWFEEVMNRNGIELWWFDNDNVDILNRSLNISDAKISVLRELEYPKGEHLAIIEISMLQENFFPKMFSNVNENESAIVVFDQNLKLVHNPFNPFIQENNLNINELREKFVGTDNQLTSSFQFMNNEKRFLAVSTYMDELNSYMLSITSLESIYSETAKTRNLVLSGIILLVIILSIITYKLISYLLKNMYLLIDSMKKVEKGNFEVDVTVDERSEFGELANHFRNMLGKINSLIADAVNKQAITKEAELRSLKTQIDAHFLYNTLENIKMMSEIEGNYEVSDAVTSLGDIMRYNLKWKNDFVSLSEELSHIQNYVDIMNLRLDNRLTLTLTIPQELKEHEVLKMSLQPIVENSIKHGISPIIYNKQGIIDIRASVEMKNIYIEITDNGIGMTQEEVAELHEKISLSSSRTEESENGSGIGLRNVHERIKIHYGNEYGMSIQSVKGQHTKVMIKIPC
ncbi:histidine kinase [Cytobacillus sp. IB215665]|uniref:sensor histidine kinase n=1 Tax=Cytobacillus sp. IB215665 TaxID=3097357 RepID=UPI002A0B4BA7|nr:histidine kinase [Cytobacillus sp. IB215665]MDX8367283.1 histidine kinase [Cytobacillus sp. IB215665]